MFEIVEPYSGHFFEAEYLEYNSETNNYFSPVLIKVKGQSEIGVSTGVRENIRIQENGRWITKKTFKINVVDVNNYKPKDKIRFIQSDNTYIVHKTSDDINHSNSMVAVMFPNSDRRPKVLYLGDN